MKKFFNINDVERKFINRELSTVGSHKFFSVVIPLINIEGEMHILYEVRSNMISSQPGEVCFPGGAIEDGETPMQTAIRETKEEVGVDNRYLRIIAEGDRLISQANFTMYTYIAEISKEGYDAIKINDSEVSEVFTVPVSWFMENEPDIHIVDLKQHSRPGFPFKKANITEDYVWISSNAEVPIYNYKGKAIWGLTGRITYNFIRILRGDI